MSKPRWRDVFRRDEDKKIVHAPENYQFVRGRGHMLVRGQSRSDTIERLLTNECKRLGWHTHNIRVKEYRPPNLAPKEPGIFFVNAGPFRGLEPNAMLGAMAALPSNCGHKRIFAALEHLEERVELL